VKRIFLKERGEQSEKRQEGQKRVRRPQGEKKEVNSIPAAKTDGMEEKATSEQSNKWENR